MRVLVRITRGIRTKSVMLSSYRQPQRRWGQWLQWELLKPIGILLPVTLLEIFEIISVPHELLLPILALCFGWMGFVSWHAWTAFQRLDKRRLDLLNAAGVVCELGTIMSSKCAWAAVKEGKTIRQILDGPPLDS